MSSYTTEYKGHTITVKRDAQADPTHQYIASCNGESAWGDSPEYATSILKSRLDLAEEFQTLKPQPLGVIGQENLRKYVRSNAFPIKARLKRKHFISTYGDPLFNEREILNHCDIIQEELKENGFDFNLTHFEFTRGSRKYCAIIDSDYYHNKPKFYEELAERILDQE